MTIQRPRERPAGVAPSGARELLVTHAAKRPNDRIRDDWLLRSDEAMVRLSWLAALLAGGVLLVTGVYRLRQRRLPSEPGGLIIVRCPLHGIAHDAERETCPSCAKAQPPDRPAGTSIA